MKPLAAAKTYSTATSPEALVQIAREWVKVDAGVLAELTRLAGKVPMPISGLTDQEQTRSAPIR